MGKINITPAEFAEKHARRLKAAIPDIQAGIAKVTDNPTVKAAAKKDKMLSRLTDSVQSGKWEAGLRRVSLEDWKASITNKGLQRIASGIDGAKAKVEAFATQLLSYESTVQNEVSAMPDMTLEDSLGRMNTWVRRMAQFKRK